MIQNYLEGADKDWQWDGIKEWDNIVVDYIWRLEDWTVFDTSIESIAKACGKYSEGRDYTQWLSFKVWAWQMIKWFDNGVIWMKLWQTKTVKFWPEEWYGQRNEQYVLSYSKEEVGDLSQFVEWQTIYLWIGAAAKIIKVTDKGITLDLNHELAWKDLIFDITLKDNFGPTNQTD
jgi:FKBP-type peptidyl-prolyl cis-trans isomerase 2